MAITTASTPLPVTTKDIWLNPNSSRVVARLFTLNEWHVRAVLERIQRLPEDETVRLIDELLADYGRRHRHIERIFRNHFDEVRGHMPDSETLSDARKLLIGAYFTMEYAVESAALFNPSIVLDPDQSGLSPGQVRIILSLRATGEGHVSSIEFRSAVLDAECHVVMHPVSRYVALPDIRKDRLYDRGLFRQKVLDMGAPGPAPLEVSASVLSEEILGAVLDPLGPTFTYDELSASIRAFEEQEHPYRAYVDLLLDRMLLLARSNYEMRFPEDTEVSERVIFPVTANEIRGIEDARFVEFTDDDGSTCYLATYTAFDGFNVVSQLLETDDFRHFRVHTLNGRYSQEKGMAIFPRRIRGQYAMIGRVDGENLFMMYSDRLHFWNDAEVIRVPEYPWEFGKIGNCGSPIETPEGWLLLTHGMGPVRRYCIGALLLDKDDPAKVIGALREPLLSPSEEQREGYVPNVVYSCGSLVHNGTLVIPYAVSDFATRIATVPLAGLVDTLKRNGP